MTGQNLSLNILGPSLLTSLLLLALSGAGAVVLYQQQSGTADVLGNDIDSRRAAADLEPTLADLAALHRGGSDEVAPLHRRVKEHLDTIARLVDKDEERRLADALRAAFNLYLRRWDEAGPREAAHRDAERSLTQEVLPACVRLKDYNARQIEESERAHRRTLRRMAWGLAGVGAAGSLAGLLLGYNVARALRRSIRELHVVVRDAASKLGPDVVVELGDDGGLEQVGGRLQGVAQQIEQVVGRLRQREREVLRAEQLAAVGQLAAGVAHEVRNPLTAIKMLVQAAQEDGPAPPGGRLAGDDLAVIENEVRRMERLLQAFLDFARPPRLERSPQDLADLAEQALGLVRGRAARQKVDLIFDRPPAPVEVSADAAQVRQVLVNLLLNALDARPRGGRVEVQVKEGPGVAEVIVCDDGPGVAAAMLPRLFEPFASDKETGLGLGLVVSRRIAEDHGGALAGNNRPEGGACFVLALPARPAAAS
jgi:signal transduction histidine kinase